MLTLTSSHQTWAHPLSAGGKLLALAATTLGLFALEGPVSLGLAASGVAALVLSGGGAFTRESLAQLRPLWPFVLVIAAWHLLTGAPEAGAVVLLRMLAAVAAANFVTMTTRLSDMLAVMERLLRPARVLGLQPKALALALALLIRFIPVMLARFDQISAAFRARSPRRAGWRVMMPATLAALDDAEHVADALRARGGAG